MQFRLLVVSIDAGGRFDRVALVVSILFLGKVVDCTLVYLFILKYGYSPRTFSQYNVVLEYYI
jgi:hypothetical protein